MLVTIAGISKIQPEVGYPVQSLTSAMRTTKSTLTEWHLQGFVHLFTHNKSPFENMKWRTYSSPETFTHRRMFVPCRGLSPTAATW
jgi:hypothetical protein